ncbi:hypothetical protein EGI22_06960 [Lacihabitans sp. LS3-19]|uniref:hypothetical protein n=1 Tax=Lacihabitans sp. LS3-19 TaxID=2487335 RepID=UPI0020CC7B2D|nr:hypothetical protein [Lacihabitans sp. LS3-19]MCP9767647.1 hypothetical protein [Lacihabitans sp. LS3-19]
MAKLLFFTKMNFGIPASGGIKNKVFAQARAFEGLGLETDILFFENSEVKIRGKNINITTNTTSKFEFLKYLYLGYLKKIKIEEYDYLYIRHFLTNPLFILMLKRIKSRNKRIKIFMEIPTYPYRFEFAHMPFKKRLELKIDDFTTSFFKKYIDRIVTFSSKKEIFGVPTLRTDNGIDIEKFGLVSSAQFGGSQLHLLGLANMQIWHGIDRLIMGLKQYYNSSQSLKVILHIVGRGDELENLIRLSEDNNLTEYIKFHGFLSGDELNNMFASCHLGIGSLGMHRINVAKGETSALKSREYASRGLPFVIAYEDRGFPVDFPFMLKLEANDNPIDINTLVEFYMEATKTNDFGIKMHEYAANNLSWKSKLLPVVEAFKL